MINLKSITDATAAIAALEPDIAIAMTAYNVLHGIWTVMNPGKTESDFQGYLQSASQLNVDTTAAYLKTQGYVQNAAGGWDKQT